MINPNELEEGGQPAMPRISNLVKASYTSSFRGMSNCLYQSKQLFTYRSKSNRFKASFIRVANR